MLAHCARFEAYLLQGPLAGLETANNIRDLERDASFEDDFPLAIDDADRARAKRHVQSGTVVHSALL